ncbi:MAG TPA: S1C family serine protease, partial [Acidimicrobiales bacterium]|nr:S1C family serine protease [Acidimicrobiales bacterium]
MVAYVASEETVPATTPLGPVTGPLSPAPGAPSNAGSIAVRVDPSLVDISVIDADQGVGGAGSGMVLTSSGDVLTNNHVVEGATSITATDVGNGATYRAAVVGYDKTQDVAVVKLEGASGLKTVRPGDSARLAVGGGVVAIGNARGAGGTPHEAGGSITGLDRIIVAQDTLSRTTERLTGLIETNAEIVPGDSGGALVNRAGDVVGMVTAGSMGFAFQGASNQGYAVPIDEALSVARQIEGHRSSTTVHIGATA